MPDSPKTIGIIILLINLLVLGPTSYIIKNMRDDIKTMKDLSRTKDDELTSRISNLKEDLLSNFPDKATYGTDINRLKNRINTLESRLYEIHNR